MQTSVRACLGLVILGASACSGAAERQSSAVQVTAPTPAASPEAVSRQLRDTDWQRLRLPRTSLEIALPEGAGWRAVPGSAWVRLAHAASDSLIELRLTSAERLVRPQDCEARARLERPDLPRADDLDAVDRQSLRAPEGFSTELTVSVLEPRPGQLEGHLVAFGAAVRRCLAVHVVTRVTGLGRDDELARRLGLMVDRVLPSLTVLGVENRVSPESFQR